MSKKVVKTRKNESKLKAEIIGRLSANPTENLRKRKNVDYNCLNNGLGVKKRAEMGEKLGVKRPIYRSSSVSSDGSFNESSKDPYKFSMEPNEFVDDPDFAAPKPVVKKRKVKVVPSKKPSRKVEVYKSKVDNILENIRTKLKKPEQNSIGNIEKTNESRDFDPPSPRAVEIPKESRHQSCGNNVQILQDISIISESEKSLNRSLDEKPWRFDVITGKRPFCFQLKPNLLPSLDQELLLDHSYDERLPNISISSEKHAGNKCLKQKSILDFIESNIENENTSEKRQSLFDIDEFSPMKSVSNKQNASLIETRNKTKRNVLTEFDSNSQIASTPIRGNLKGNEENINLDDVSFIRKDGAVAGHPFRFDISKKYNKRVPKNRGEPVRDTELHQLIENDPEIQGRIGDTMPLYEDLDNVEDERDRVEVPMKKSRKKLHCLNDPTEIASRKRETKLSKEAMEWIESFNKMCEEVDKVELEIE